jgi:phosphoglycolate phosphatase-like HAD superfamily hydrolase
MVGDFLFDIQSGRAAGTRTVLMIGDAPRPQFADQADHVIRRLPQLLPLL